MNKIDCIKKRLMKHLIGNIKPEKVFFIFGLFFGLFFVFSTPPMQVPDEHFHYAHILRISEGRFLPEKQGNNIGSNLTENQIEFIKDPPSIKRTLLETKIPWGGKVGERSFFRGTTTYSPVAYIPQITGVLLAKTLSLNQALIFYSARLFSLMFFLVVAYYSIKIVPFGKWFYLSVALLPMTLFLAASNSADQMVISMSMFVVAFFLYVLSKKSLKRSDIYIIFISTFLISFLKTPVALIALVYLFLPIKYFKDKRHYIYYVFSLMALVAIITLAWSYVVSIYNTKEIIRATYPNIVADPKEQLSFIINNPLTYLKTFVKTFWLRGGFYINTMIGSLGLLKTWFKDLIYTSYVILLVISLMVDDKSYEVVKRIVRLAALAILLSMIFIIPTLLYLVWTPVGEKIIEGVQGRYFLPILFLLPAIVGGLFTKKVEKNVINYNLLLITGNLILLSLCAYHFFNCYYKF